jgi:broad specificity phosphatase PhoE
MARYPAVPTEVLPMEEFTYLEPSRWNGTLRLQRLPHIEAYWGNADPTYCDGSGAESFETLLGRVQRTLKRLESLPTNSLVYAFSHGQFMQAVRISLLFPTWTAKQKMTHFWPFNAKYAILNTDRLLATYDGRLWSTPPPHLLGGAQKFLPGHSQSSPASD